MKRFVNALVVIALAIPLAALCVPAYFGVLALSIEPAREEILNRWALADERITEYNTGALDQVGRYHPASCLVARGAGVYAIPLPPGAAPFESARHPRRPGRAQYLVRTAPFEAWRDDLALTPPEGFAYERIGGMPHFTSEDGNISAFITGSAFARVYTLLEVSAWGSPPNGSGPPKLIPLD